jgi:hypothetical protein
MHNVLRVFAALLSRAVSRRVRPLLGAMWGLREDYRLLGIKVKFVPRLKIPLTGA